MRLVSQALLCGVVVVAFSATVHATVIGQHVGSAAPTTEGFSLQGVFGTGVDDGGTAAWQVDAVWGRYIQNLSAEQLTSMSTDGWTLQETVRMGNAGLNWDNENRMSGIGAMEVATDTFGDCVYSIGLGTDASGNPIVYQFNENHTPNAHSLLGTVTGTGYHTYTLSHATGAANANLYVDGTFMTTVTPTDGFGVARYLIGNTAGAYDGSPAVGAYFAGASLSTGFIVPEPTTLTLLMTGVVGMLAYAWKRRW